MSVSIGQVASRDDNLIVKLADREKRYTAVHPPHGGPGHG
jgi:hypothetical protein